MSTFPQPSTGIERTDALAVAGGVLCVALLCLVVFAGRTKGLELAAYLFLFFAAPLLAAIGVHGFLQREPRPMPVTVGKAFIAGVLLFACLLTTPYFEQLSGARVMSLAVLGALGCALAAAALGRSQPGVSERIAHVALVVFLALALILLSPLDAAARLSSTMVDYMVQTPRFRRWLVAGVVYAALVGAAAVWETRTRHERARKWATVLVAALGMLFALGLYDDGHWVDIGHYAPLIGPALHWNAGGIPMVEIYCQYGLGPWLFISALFSLLEPTAGTAAIAVRLLNAAYFLALLAFAFVVSRRKIMAVLVMLPVLLAGISFHAGHLNLNGLPSTQGMRYLLPLLMALLLAVDPKPWIGRAATALLVVASFWSIETFLYTLLAWGGHVAVEALRQRQWKALLKPMGRAFGAMAAAHVLFVLGVFVASGRWVDYIPYVDIFVGFLIGRGSWPWPTPMASEFLWWLPIWLAYFLTLALALLGALRREAPGRADRLVPLALMGVSALSYYVGRSSPTTLGLSFLPFAVLVLCAFEAMLDQRRPLVQRAPVAGLIAILFVLVFAFALERFARPLNVLAGNSTVLRRCFTTEGCSPPKVIARIRNAVHMAVDYRYPHVDGLDQMPVRVEELAGLLRTHAGGARRVALLTELNGESALTWFYGLMALQKTGQWYSWRTSSPLNDALSPILARRIVRAATVRDGEPVIIVKQEDALIPLEKSILAKIRGACRLEKVAEGGYFAVFRADGCRWEKR